MACGSEIALCSMAHIALVIELQRRGVMLRDRGNQLGVTCSKLGSQLDDLAGQKEMGTHGSHRLETTSLFLGERPRN